MKNKDEIKKYLEIVNPETKEMDINLINFVIDEIIDRVELYLNTENVPEKLNRILANIVNTGLKKCNTNNDLVITSISDNGQSISYSNEVMRYFTTTSDEELFSGFTSLLNRYRRIKVVYPRKLQEEN